MKRVRKVWQVLASVNKRQEAENDRTHSDHTRNEGLNQVWSSDMSNLESMN